MMDRPLTMNYGVTAAPSKCLFQVGALKEAPEAVSDPLEFLECGTVNFVRKNASDPSEAFLINADPGPRLFL
jgi:hypothetical protein